MGITLDLGWLRPSTLREMLDDERNARDNSDTWEEEVSHAQNIVVLAAAINGS